MRISRIIADLKNRPLSAAQRALWEAGFAAPGRIADVPARPTKTIVRPRSGVETATSVWQGDTATVTIPLTIVTRAFGMNVGFWGFNQPEGLYLALALMIAPTLILVVWMRRKGWL